MVAITDTAMTMTMTTIKTGSNFSRGQAEPCPHLHLSAMSITSNSMHN